MHVTILTRSFGPMDVLRVEACVCVVVSGAPGGHEVQEGDGAGGATVLLLQGAALFPGQVDAGNQVPEDT